MMKQDLRSIRSVANIKKAFVDLLQEKPFEKIKVSEIARKAGIDRQTFYLHFVDKYDLLDKMNKEFLQVYKTILVERLEGDNSFALRCIARYSGVCLSSESDIRSSTVTPSALATLLRVLVDGLIVFHL